MKKRTTITTEKREVWIISEGGALINVPAQPVDDAPPDAQSMTISEPEASPETATTEQEQDNEK